jgi:hypothetical protein
MAETNAGRLDRIEQKLDRMSEAVIQLARVEEKMDDLEVRRVEQHERMNRLSSKIDNIDSHVVTLVEKVAFMQKFAWALIGVVATVVGATLTNFLS